MGVTLQKVLFKQLSIPKSIKTSVLTGKVYESYYN